MRDIGKNIRVLRLRQKMTQDELAERLFVTRQTVSNYETGKSKPDVEMLITISEVLGADVHQLIYGPEPTADTLKKRRLLIGVGFTVVFLLIYLLIRPAAEALRRDAYLVSLNALNHIVFLPLTLLSAGWTLGQLIGMALRREPLSFVWIKYARTGLVVILAVLLGLNFLLFGSEVLNDWLHMHELRGEWVETEVTNTLTGETYTSMIYQRLPMPITEWLQLFAWNYMILFTYKQLWIFPLLGAALWLLGFPKRKIQ